MTASSVTALLLILTLGGSTVGACTIVSTSVPVGRSFQVSLRDVAATSTKRWKIRLRAAGGQEYTAVTNKQGIARFVNIRDGSYSVWTQDDLELSDTQLVDVSSENQSGLTVPIPSRSQKRVVARSLAGVLLVSGEVWGRRSAVSVHLLDRAGKELKRTVTDSAGRFSFPEMPPERYILRLAAGSGGGSIPVEVQPAATETEIEVELSWSSCGLHYVDRRQCAAASDLQVQRLSGFVRDATGAAISDAQILLLDLSDRIIEQSRSDHTGGFALNSTETGTYQLMVMSSPFTTLRTNVIVNPQSTPRQVVAELGFTGCSKASVR